MPFTLDRFCELRPFLYHLTSRENAERIIRSRVLHSAAALRRAAGESGDGKRRDHQQLVVQGDPVMLRDQRPLHPGNVTLTDGWTWTDLLEDLNRRVFFWPGRTDGPISYGRRLYGRYAHESPILLRCRSRELFEANHPAEPTFCRYNSGAPRCVHGVGSPRGANTFVVANQFAGSAAKVIEVTYLDTVQLPQLVEESIDGGMSWRLGK